MELTSTCAATEHRSDHAWSIQPSDVRYQRLPGQRASVRIPAGSPGWVHPAGFTGRVSRRGLRRSPGGWHAASLARDLNSGARAGTLTSEAWGLHPTGDVGLDTR